MDCPYLPKGSPKSLVCDGEYHTLVGTDIKKVCPLVTEAWVWATQFGVRGDRPYLFDTYRILPGNEEAIVTIMSWAESPCGIIILSALPGRGKSRLALSVWYRIRRSLRKCIIVSATGFHELAVMHSKGEDTRGLMKAYVGVNPVFVDASEFDGLDIGPDRSVPVVFDDLGSERTSDTFRDYFRQLLNYHENILITTNHTKETLGSLLGGRVESRLASATWLYLVGEDMRKVKFVGCGDADE